MIWYVSTPSKIPSLGYEFHRNGLIVETVRVNGKIIQRKTYYPSKKVRRRIGRRIRRHPKE